MFNSELEFQSALIRRLKELWAYCRNIPDIWNTKKPFDLSINYNRIWWAFELKIIKTQKAPTPEAVYKKLYAHQIANLIQFQSWKSWWISRVIAYHDKTDSVYFYTIDTTNVNPTLSESSSWLWNSDYIKNEIDLIFR